MAKKKMTMMIEMMMIVAMLSAAMQVAIVAIGRCYQKTHVDDVKIKFNDNSSFLSKEIDRCYQENFFPR